MTQFYLTSPMRVLIRSSVYVAILVFLLAWTNSFAVVATAFPLSELVARSDMIVVGKVLDSKTYKMDFESLNAISGTYMTRENMILTDYKIEILNIFKGSLEENESFMFTVFGGEVDGQGFWCSACFVLEEGSTILAFLKWNRANEKWLSIEVILSVFKIEGFGEANRLVPFEDITVFVSPEFENLPITGAVLNLQSLQDVTNEIRRQKLNQSQP